VTRVYVDVEAVAIGGPAANAMLDPAALRSLQFLAEAGHPVFLVAADPPPAQELRAFAADVVAVVPVRPDTAAWYMTTDVDRCQGASAKLRTVLIGAAPLPGSIHRCDAVARDLQTAALEVLAAEAMPPP